MPVPDWLQDTIFYQIFPDRFAKSEGNNMVPNLQDWGAEPTLSGFQGGDLQGIQQKLDYLNTLGVNAIYLNPIFLSPSNHRYNTSDYYTIDPRLGTQADFKFLIDAAHAQGMRVVLDGVFNHCSRGFFAFVDVLENWSSSGYQDWFHIKKFPLRAYEHGKARNYLGWWGYKSLPKFNTENPAVRQYIFNIARYWIDQGADGWRLDVPNEIDDDAFWAEFRQTVKAANPEACLIGEIWTASPRWVGDNHFDGLMNYPLRAAILGLLMPSNTPHSGPQIQPLTLPEFATQVEDLLHIYPRQNVYCMYNLLSSHDTERMLTLLNGDTAKAKLALAFLFAYPGPPAIYYGDEIGLTGGRDPQCRKAFPWQVEDWNLDLYSWVQRLMQIRKQLPALRQGDYQRLLLNEAQHCYAFERSFHDQRVLILLNTSQESQDLLIDWEHASASDLYDLLENKTVNREGAHIHLQLPAWGCAWIGEKL